jgi:hypoxanthine phosphoribosyltransferase
VVEMRYTRKEIKKLSWREIERDIDKIKNKLDNYLKKEGIVIDTIIPILRGGGIPANILSHKYNVLKIIPVQYKYFSDKKTIIKELLKLDLKKLKNSKNILVVEGNHSTGTIANKIVSEIKKKLSKSKIIYVSLTKDYSFKDKVKADFSVEGRFTNENRNLSKAECKKLKIPFSKVYVFPWESIEEELSELNQESYNYIR